MSMLPKESRGTKLKVMSVCFIFAFSVLMLTGTDRSIQTFYKYFFENILFTKFFTAESLRHQLLRIMRRRHT